MSANWPPPSPDAAEDAGAGAGAGPDAVVGAGGAAAGSVAGAMGASGGILTACRGADGAVGGGGGATGTATVSCARPPWRLVSWLSQPCVSIPAVRRPPDVYFLGILVDDNDLLHRTAHRGFM